MTIQQDNTNKHILMLSGDWAIAYGKKNVFYEMLKDFSKHWGRVSVILPSNEIGDEIRIHDNVYLYPSPYSKKFHLDFFKHKGFILKKGREIFKKNPFDIIAAHVIPPLFANTKAAMKLSKELRVPSVAEIFHIPGYPKANNFGEKIERFCLNRFFKKNQAKTPYVRVINRVDTHDYVVKELGFSEEKLLYIPCFYLDFEVFKPNPSIARNPKQFVLAGRLEKNKGLELLLDASRMVAQEVPDFKLKIIGEGSLQGYTEDFIKKNKLSKNIELMGWLTWDELPRAYQESAAMLMTSYNEGGPRVTLEAMACGALAITTQVGIMREVVEDKDNALFINWDSSDIAEKILWTIKNPEKAAHLAEKGRESVQQFECGKMLARYADIYKGLIDG